MAPVNKIYAILSHALFTSHHIMYVLLYCTCMTFCFAPYYQEYLGIIDNDFHTSILCIDMYA